MSDTPDDDYDEIEAEYDRHREALFELVSNYAEEHDLEDALLTGLLLDLSVSMRMLLYAYGTEKPSSGGLKLELDRFLKEVGDHVREVKKGADDFIADIKADRDSN